MNEHTTQLDKYDESEGYTVPENQVTTSNKTPNCPEKLLKTPIKSMENSKNFYWQSLDKYKNFKIVANHISIYCSHKFA